MGFLRKLLEASKNVELPESLVTDNYRIDITYRVKDDGRIEAHLYVKEHPGNAKRVLWVYTNSGSDYYSELYIRHDNAKGLKKRLTRILSKSRNKINKIEMNIRAISSTNYDKNNSGVA